MTRRIIVATNGAQPWREEGTQLRHSGKLGWVLTNSGVMGAHTES